MRIREKMKVRDKVLLSLLSVAVALGLSSSVYAGYKFDHMSAAEHLKAAEDLCKYIGPTNIANVEQYPYQYFNCSGDDRDQALNHLKQISLHTGTLESDKALLDTRLLQFDQEHEKQNADKLAQAQAQAQQQEQAERDQREEQQQQQRDLQEKEDKLYQEVWQKQYQACLAQMMGTGSAEHTKQVCENMLAGKVTQ